MKDDLQRKQMTKY